MFVGVVAKFPQPSPNDLAITMTSATQYQCGISTVCWSLICDRPPVSVDSYAGAQAHGWMIGPLQRLCTLFCKAACKG